MFIFSQRISVTEYYERGLQTKVSEYGLTDILTLSVLQHYYCVQIMTVNSVNTSI